MKRLVTGLIFVAILILQMLSSGLAQDTGDDELMDRDEKPSQGAGFQKEMEKFEAELNTYKQKHDEKGVSRTLCYIGDIYRKNDEYSKALTFYEQALKIKREIGDINGQAIILANLGIVYRNLSEYQKAISCYEESLKLKRELGDRKGVGNNLTNLGVVHRNLGEYQKAISYYEESLKIKSELGDKKGIGGTLNNLGVVCLGLGEYQKAISYYEESLKIKRELGDKKGIGSTITNLGIVYRKRGEYQKAISYYEESLKIKRELGDRKGVGNNLTNLGVVYRNLGEYQKAISYYEESLKIKRELGDKKGIGGILNNLGVVCLGLGEYQKAISYFEGAFKVNEEIGVSTRRGEANVADVYLEMGQIEKAEREYLRVGGSIRLGRLNLVKKNYSKAVEYYDKSLQEDLQNRNAEFLFADYCGLGHGYFGLKDYKKAKKNYEKTITFTEEERESLGEEEKAKFFVARIQGFLRTEPYEGMVQVLNNLNQPTEAFFYSENLKARTLAEAIARGQSSLGKSLPPDFAKTEQDFITQIRGLRKEMETLYQNQAMDAYAEKEKEIKAVKIEQDKFISQLRGLYPEYASINYPKPMKPAEIKLNPSEVLIEFEVTEEATLVFLLKGGKIQLWEIPITRKDLQDQVLTYRNYFEGIGSAKDLFNFKSDSGKKLYTLLFRDMLNSLPAGTSLVIVPDEFLGVLPFEALVTDMAEKEQVGEGKYGPFPLGVKYLGDKYNIIYAQSGTSLSMLRSLKKGTTVEGTALAVCDPIFSRNDKRLTQVAAVNLNLQGEEVNNAIREWKTMGVAGLKQKEEGRVEANEEEIFPRLDKTGEIAQGVKGLFGEKATVLVGDKAREEDVAKLPFSRYRYITFATHGILDNAIPWVQEPALVLTQVGNSDGYDGFLTMSEVMGLKMGADVVALTACETGVGKNVRGEGVMGMGRAFQYAGAGNVLMSLWSVAEDATVALSNSFFKNLKEGKDSKEALRLARADIRTSGYEHPFYWSAFILVGR